MIYLRLVDRIIDQHKRINITHVELRTFILFIRLWSGLQMVLRGNQPASSPTAWAQQGHLIRRLVHVHVYKHRTAIGLLNSIKVHPTSPRWTVTCTTWPFIWGLWSADSTFNNQVQLTYNEYNTVSLRSDNLNCGIFLLVLLCCMLFNELII